MSVAAPSVRGRDARSPSHRRTFDYLRLFQVTIGHEYYGRGHAGVAWFQTAPTPATAARLRALGMYFRSERDGFSVLYDTAQAWSARAAHPDGADPLSFDVVCPRSHFVSITEMGLDTSPRATPFHVSHRVASDSAAPAANVRPDDRLVESPSTVPLRAELRAAPPSVAPMIQVSSAVRPIPIAVIDIALGTPASRGGCPMPLPDGSPAALPVSYDVVFPVRRTFWRYHIASQAGSGPLDNLAIDPAMFLGPFRETLVNGAQSHRFLSKTPIALASRSRVRWSLHGRRRDRMTRDAVLVERLPVAAVDQIGLLTADECEALGVTGGACSEMHVYV